MITLFDFMPKVCPNCAKELRPDPIDFYGHASHTCSCGMKFEYVKTDHLVDTANRDGDMGMFL